jgi:GT2 family glycosyltransferase
VKTAVVILNWNGKELLEKFLPALIKHTPADLAEIYVVDNASTDGSTDYIRNHFPNIKLIIHPDNYGYARGYNLALQDIDAEVYCLLNSDIEVTANWLTPVLEHYRKNPETAIIQPKIKSYHKREYFEYAGAAGGFIDKYAYPYCRGRIFDSIEKDLGQYDNSIPVFWASGACFFIRRETYKELGGMDETYIAHQEEIDLCWRAYNAGHQTWYIPESTVYHIGGATLDSSQPYKTFLNFRNSLFNILKNAPSPYLKIFIRLLADGLAGINFLSAGKISHTWAIIKAHFSFYAHFTAIKNKRGNIRKKAGYYTIPNIVYTYYVKGIKYYSDLDTKNGGSTT